MKRTALLRHLRRYGCVLKREGRSHSLWMNPETGEVEAVPRHVELRRGGDVRGLMWGCDPWPGPGTLIDTARTAGGGSSVCLPPKPAA